MQMQNENDVDVNNPSLQRTVGAISNSVIIPLTLGSHFTKLSLSSIAKKQNTVQVNTIIPTFLTSSEKTKQGK